MEHVVLKAKKPTEDNSHCRECGMRLDAYSTENASGLCDYCEAQQEGEEEYAGKAIYP